MSSNPVLGFIGQRSYLLGILLIYAALFGRLASVWGIPGIVKFFHFAIAAMGVVFVLPFVELSLIKKIFFGLIAFLCVIASSALLNGAGMINVFLDFLLLCEPFLLFLLLLNKPLARFPILVLRYSLILALLLHTVLAYIQFFTNGHQDPDLIKGIFLEQGAGHHVGGAVALSGAIYVYSKSTVFSQSIRLITAIFIAGVVVLSDSKQVVAVFIVSLATLLILKLDNLTQFLRYFALTVSTAIFAGGGAFYLFPGLTYWADLSLIQQGLEVKLGILSRIVSYYDSPFHWILGLGPGHTIGRLALILPDYFEQLKQLGATHSLITQESIAYQQSHWISNSVTGSSMWSPFFFWAGLWGDLGIIGTGLYLYLWLLVFRHVCLEDISRFLVITIVIFGGVFSWLEEPGYMLFVAGLISLLRQEYGNSQSVNSSPLTSQ